MVGEASSLQYSIAIILFLTIGQNLTHNNPHFLGWQVSLSKTAIRTILVHTFDESNPLLERGANDGCYLKIDLNEFEFPSNKYIF